MVLKFLYTNHKKKTDIKWNQGAGSSVFLCLQIESNHIVNVFRRFKLNRIPSFLMKICQKFHYKCEFSCMDYEFYIQQDEIINQRLTVTKLMQAKIGD